MLLPVSSEPIGDGRYVAVGLLARGGMGEVQLGLRLMGSFRRLVAIKRLRPELASDASYRRMFLDEARVAGLVRHSNVVSVLDVGEDDAGPFLVMDFVEGVTAHQMLRALTAAGERLPLQIAIRVAQQVAEGLAAVHELRATDGAPIELIHRDVSPQNILLGFDGVARVVDFGIAKPMGSRATTTGVLKGKIGYMSPEQLRFQKPTQRSDLFALGVVLYELVTCARLYRGADALETAQLILNAPAPDLYADHPDAPPDLVELVFELLAKEPEDRPPSARDVARRLQRTLEDLVVMEGAIPLADYLGQRFEGEALELRERSASMIRAWESARVEASARASRRRWMAGAAAAAIALGAGGLVAFAARPDTLAPPTAAAHPPVAPAASPPGAPLADDDPSTAAPTEAAPAAAQVARTDTIDDSIDDPADDPADAPAEPSGPIAEGAAPRDDARRDAARPRRRRARRAREDDAAAPSEGFRAIDLIRGER